VIPCNNMALEVEVPDPQYNYFVLEQDVMNGTKWVAPDVIPSEPLDYVWNKHEFKASNPTGDPWFPESWNDPSNIHRLDYRLGYLQILWKFGDFGIGSNRKAQFYGAFGKTDGNYEEVTPFYEDATYDTLNGCDGPDCEPWDVPTTDPYVYDSTFGIAQELSDMPPTIKDGALGQIFLDEDTASGYNSHYWLVFNEQWTKTYNDSNMVVVRALPDKVEVYSYDPVPITKMNLCLSGLETFVLGESCLDGDIDLLEGVGAVKPGYIWQDLLNDATSVQIERGMDVNQGIVGTPIAGVMRAQILDPYLDALQTQKVGIGQRCRFRAGANVVYSGIVNVLASEYGSIEIPTLLLESFDAFGLLQAILVDERPAEEYTTRVRAAVQEAGLPNQLADSTTMLTPTENPRTALETVIKAQDSEGSVCWIDRHGVFYSTNRYWQENQNLRFSNFDNEPAVVFTNGEPVDEPALRTGTANNICLSRFLQTADTRQVINGITFRNDVEEDDVDFEGKPIKTIVTDEYSYSSTQSQRLYGNAGITLSTNLDPSELPAYSEYIFETWDTPRVKVEAVEWPLDKYEDLSIPREVNLDIGDKVRVIIDDPYGSGARFVDSTQRIAKVADNITPQEWVRTLDLI
jgi:hypothetical protein